MNNIYKKISKKLSNSLFLAFVVFVMTSCSSTAVDVSTEKDPAKLYQEGVKALKDNDYLTAQDVFSEIKKRFSQSRYFALAELRAADLEFDQENYAEAAVLYENFVELNPNHPEAPYAQFRKAKSYIEDNPENEARDQSAASLASSAASQLIKRYPGSAYEKEAREIYYRGRFQLAKKEAYIARFYRKKGFNKASLKRWQKIPAEFKDLNQYAAAKDFFEEVRVAIQTQNQKSEN